MKHERMKILELLEEGKITADEATKLLEAIKRPKDGEWFEIDGPTQEQMEEKFKNFTKHVDTFTKEFGGKVEDVYRRVEPKIKKASQAVLEKTAAVFDEISKSLNESVENARKHAAADDCCEGDCDEPKEN